MDTSPVSRIMISWCLELDVIELCAVLEYEAYWLELGLGLDVTVCR